LTAGQIDGILCVMISFIIPIYNKGSILLKTLNSLTDKLSKAKFSKFEIIIIDDGSKDDSFYEAFRFKRSNKKLGKIKIFHYGQNLGKGYALKYGFIKSTGDPVIFLDGDMDIDTKQVIKAIEKFNKINPDILIGSKYHIQSRLHYPFNRYLYSRILKIIIWLLFNLSVTDTQVGLKIFQRKVLAKVFPKILVKRFAVDLEILIVANKYGYKKIIEIPVIIKHTSANCSTINYMSTINFMQDLASLFYRNYILHHYD